MSFLVWLYLDATLAFLQNNALGCQPINLFAKGDAGTVVAMRCPLSAWKEAISYGDYLPGWVTDFKCQILTEQQP